jgi:endonuclease/exonuclease/phosphatase family metal-dependent hydrolase
MAGTHGIRVGTLNLASGRDPSGRPVPDAELAAALVGLDVDVLAVEEVDAGQPRSAGVDQAAVVAAALDLPDWRYVATLAGTPGPVRTWTPIRPLELRAPGEPPEGPRYGIALLSRLPVRRWSVVDLGAGRARLPVRAADPRTGRRRTWWIPDEPRAAVVAELDGLTVVGTHLSFAPVTAVRQLRRLSAALAGLPHPFVVAGDLNLPGGVPARILGAEALVRAATYPASRPRTQLDHLLGRGVRAEDGTAVSLSVGDHRLVTATVSAR